MRRSAATSPTFTASQFRRISSPRSPTLSSTMSDSWQNRPLDPCYPIVWVDALVVKIRTDGVVRNRPAYLVLGLNVEGRKEALGLWIGKGGESAKFWLKIFNDIKNRGVDTICVVCCDGLTALPEAIEAVYGDAWIQTCVGASDP